MQVVKSGIHVQQAMIVPELPVKQNECPYPLCGGTMTCESSENKNKNWYLISATLKFNANITKLQVWKIVHVCEDISTIITVALGRHEPRNSPSSEWKPKSSNRAKDAKTTNRAQFSAAN